MGIDPLVPNRYQTSRIANDLSPSPSLQVIDGTSGEQPNALTDNSFISQPARDTDGRPSADGPLLVVPRRNDDGMVQRGPSNTR